MANMKSSSINMDLSHVKEMELNISEVTSKPKMQPDSKHTDSEVTAIELTGTDFKGFIKL